MDKIKYILLGIVLGVLVGATTTYLVTGQRKENPNQTTNTRTTSDEIEKFKKEEVPETKPEVSFVVKNGRVYKRQGGTETPLEDAVTLSNDTYLDTQGNVFLPDGTQVKLSEKQILWGDGTIETAEFE